MRKEGSRSRKEGGRRGEAKREKELYMGVYIQEKRWRALFT